MKKEQVLLIDALNQIVKEKGINIDLVFEAIESSLVFACKKNYGANCNFKVLINRESGQIDCFSQKEIVETVEDNDSQISLKEAQAIKPFYQIGDILDISIKPKDFGRIAAQTAKQIIVQKIREAEREIIFNEYIEKEGEMVTGIVQRKEKKNVIISIGKVDAVMPPTEQIPSEEYLFSNRIKIYVTEVKQTSKGPIVNVSRTHPGLVARLFEQEVPEIYDGIVEIKSISREAGQRTKISVLSHDPNVDPVGACVGPGGSRVNIVVSELRGEKIDIIHWNQEPKYYIESALSPSKVLDVTLDEETKTAFVIVPKYQLSLAIGKDGQNARLAAKLTGYRIDIKSETDQENPQAYEDYYNQNEYITEDGELDTEEYDVFSDEDISLQKDE